MKLQTAKNRMRNTRQARAREANRQKRRARDKAWNRIVLSWVRKHYPKEGLYAPYELLKKKKWFRRAMRVKSHG